MRATEFISMAIILRMKCVVSSYICFETERLILYIQLEYTNFKVSIFLRYSLIFFPKVLTRLIISFCLFVFAVCLVCLFVFCLWLWLCFCFLADLRFGGLFCPAFLNYMMDLDQVSVFDVKSIYMNEF